MRLRHTLAAPGKRYPDMKRDTDTVGEFLQSKIDTIIRGLPPEEREKITFSDGAFSGPPDLVRKVKDLMRREDAHGSAGD